MGNSGVRIRAAEFLGMLRMIFVKHQRNLKGLGRILEVLVDLGLELDGSGVHRDF